MRPATPYRFSVQTPVPPGFVPATRHGFTLVEVLVSLSLALILLGAVVVVFGRVGGSINGVRAALEQFDRLRVAEQRLRMDLDGETVTTIPPRKPDDNEGYLEYGEKGFPATPWDSSAGTVDLTVNQHNDYLMLTTRTKGMPFVGRYNTTTLQSDTAEVAWFVRGRTLHRRQLLVVPGVSLTGAATPFYAYYDVSATSTASGWVPNTLGDLTKRENRFAHPTDVFPFDASRWGQYGLPTLFEGASGTAITCPSTPPVPLSTEDLWNPQPLAGSTNYWLTDWALVSPASATPPTTTRLADDIILTNVIGFDVKAWDPTVKAYVDLGYNNVPFSAANAFSLGHSGHPKSGLTRVYDTYSFHYEQVGTSAGDPHAGRATNGFDNDGDGVVNNIVYTGNPATGENETAPPYPIPLRGIQVKIRIFEPDSRQIREVTVTHDFLPK